MITYYSQKHRCLVCVHKNTDPEYWDRHWDNAKPADIYSRSDNVSEFVFYTKRYLSSLENKILEGGCGSGGFVLALAKEGYNVVGLDYAPRTIARLNKRHPELDVRLGDVRKLAFPNDTFDGYWSLGVIEHFWNGYEEILNEAVRVLRPGGYLFLTFPSMSPLRRLKVALGIYKNITEETEPERFYQFTLNVADVISELSKRNMDVVEICRRSGLKGLSEEITAFDLNSSMSLLTRGLRYAFRRLHPGLWGHSSLIVARKR